MTWLKPVVAEFLGTFFLCFAGIAAMVSTAGPYSSGAGLVGVALAHGLALSVAVSIFGGVSGAHVNPAVTIALWSTGRIDGVMSCRYILSQLAAATVAALACWTVFAEEAVSAKNLGIPLPEVAGTTGGTIFLVEFILTFLLVTAVFGTAVDEPGKAVRIGGFGVGLTVTFGMLAGGALTGASMNPARSFGPALIQWDWSWHYLYWLAPIIGGVVAAQVNHHVLLAPDEESDSDE